MSTHGMVPNALTSTGPAMARWGDTLFFAWKGKSTDDIRWSVAAMDLGTYKANGWKELDTVQWTVSNQILAGRKTKFSPALASDGVSLAIAWTDADTGRVKVSMLSAAGGWEQPEDVPHSFSDGPPAIAFYLGNLHVAWHDPHSIDAAWIFGTVRLNGAFLPPVGLSGIGPASHHAPALTSVDAYGGPSSPVPISNPNQSLDFSPYPQWAVVAACRGIAGVIENDSFIVTLSNLFFTSYLFTEEYPNPWAPNPGPLTALEEGVCDRSFPHGLTPAMTDTPGTPAVAIDNQIGLTFAWSDNGKIQFGGSSALAPFYGPNSEWESSGAPGASVPVHGSSTAYGVALAPRYSNGTFSTPDKPALAYATFLKKGYDQSRFLLCAWRQSDQIFFYYGPMLVSPDGRVVVVTTRGIGAGSPPWYPA